MLPLLVLLGCAHTAALSTASASVDIDLRYTRAPGERVRQRVLVDGTALGAVPEEARIDAAPHRDVFHGRLPAGTHDLRVLVRFFDDTTPEAEPDVVVGAGVVGPMGAAVPMVTVIPGEEPEESQRTGAMCEIAERITVEPRGRYDLRFTFVEDGTCSLVFQAKP